LQSIVQSIDIAYKNYYLKSLNNNDSLPDHDFIVKKISGILYNNSLPPIEKEKRHTLNYVKKFRTDWDVSCTNNFLSAITNYFKDNCYNSESILTEFNFIRKLIFENDTLNQWIECVVDHIAEH